VVARRGREALGRRAGAGPDRGRLHEGDADGAVEWDWLVEVDLPDHDGQDARRGLSELLLDLRLLGMQPSVVAVGRPIGTPAR